jgi:hypothetical protein
MPESPLGNTALNELPHLERTRRVTRRTAVIGGLCVAGAAVWALLPLEADIPAFPKIAPAEPKVATPVPLDLAAFQSPAWTVESPPVTPVVAQAPPPPPPLRVQLIGIVRDAEQDKAILYDPDSNKVFAVFAGELVHGRRVERVAGGSVSIGGGSSAQVLTLKNGGTP